MNALETLADCRVVPVVVINDASHAIELANTLLTAGIKAIEITLRTTAAASAIKQIATEVPGILVGAGSVRRASQVAEIAELGARFAVSPGATAPLLESAKRLHMPFVPGAATASENMLLLDHGYELQKFFPAELSGGTAQINAISAPLPEVKFFPTGGITAELAPAYLQTPSVHCIGGTWIATTALLDGGDFQTIGELADAAVRLAAD